MSVVSEQKIGGYAIFGIVKALAFAAFFGTLGFIQGEPAFAFSAIALGVAVATVPFLVTSEFFQKKLRKRTN